MHLLNKLSNLFALARDLYLTYGLRINLLRDVDVSFSSTEIGHFIIVPPLFPLFVMMPFLFIGCLSSEWSWFLLLLYSDERRLLSHFLRLTSWGSKGLASNFKLGLRSHEGRMLRHKLARIEHWSRHTLLLWLEASPLRNYGLHDLISNLLDHHGHISDI
jgi:hypothetical protein